MQPSGPTNLPVGPPKAKRALFWAILLLGLYLFTEFASWLCLFFVYGGWGPAVSKFASASQGDETIVGMDAPEDALHPYLGWVRRPRRFSPHPEDAGYINNFGYPDPEGPLRQPDPRVFVVAVLGGSLAEEFNRSALPALELELEKSERLSGREIHFVRLAISGYKQPQQLLTLNYLLALGGHFDCVINIDGYNELVLPAVENVPNRVFASFPRGWQARVTQTGESAALRRIGMATHIKDKMRHTGEIFSSFPARLSPTLMLVGMSYFSSLQNELFREFDALNELKGAGGNYVVTGPPQAFSDDAEVYDESAKVWARSSLSMQQLCLANGIAYCHFLQPNQYVAGSKEFYGVETEFASTDHPGKKHVEAGYAYLQRQGAELLRLGVPFFDLTDIFQGYAEATYRDNCCHLNERGNTLLAERIGQTVVKVIDGR